MKSALSKRASEPRLAVENRRKSVTFDKTDEIIRYEMASPSLHESDVSEEERPLPTLPTLPVMPTQPTTMPTMPTPPKPFVDARQRVLDQQFQGELQNPIEDPEFDFGPAINKRHSQELEFAQLQAQIRDLQTQLDLSSSSVDETEETQLNEPELPEPEEVLEKDATNSQPPVSAPQPPVSAPVSRHARVESNSSILSEPELYLPFTKPPKPTEDEEGPVLMRSEGLLARQDSLQAGERALPTQGNSLPFPNVERSYSKRRQQILQLLDPHGPATLRPAEFAPIIEEDEALNVPTLSAEVETLEVAGNDTLDAILNAEVTANGSFVAMREESTTRTTETLDESQNASLSAEYSENTAKYGETDDANVAHERVTGLNVVSAETPQSEEDEEVSDESEDVREKPSFSFGSMPSLQYALPHEDMLHKLDVPQPQFATRPAETFSLPQHLQTPNDMHLDSDLDDMNSSPTLLTSEVEMVESESESPSEKTNDSVDELDVNYTRPSEENEDTLDRTPHEDFNRQTEYTVEDEDLNESSDTPFELDPDSHFDSVSSGLAESFRQRQDLSIRSLLLLRDASVLSALSTLGGRDPSMVSLRVDFGDDRAWLGGFLRNPDALRELNSRIEEIDASEATNGNVRMREDMSDEVDEDMTASASDEESSVSEIEVTSEGEETTAAVGNETIGISHEPAALYAAGLSPEIGNFSTTFIGPSYSKGKGSEGLNVLSLLKPEPEVDEVDEVDEVLDREVNEVNEETTSQSSLELEKPPQFASSIDLDSVLSRDTAELFTPLKEPEQARFESSSPLLYPQHGPGFSEHDAELSSWITSDSEETEEEIEMNEATEEGERTETGRSFVLNGDGTDRVAPEILQFIYKNSPELGFHEQETEQSSTNLVSGDVTSATANFDASLLHEPSLGENMASTMHSLLSASFSTAQDPKRGYILRDSGSLVVAALADRALPHRPTGYEIVPDGDALVYQQTQRAIPRRPLPLASTANRNAPSVPFSASLVALNPENKAITTDSSFPSSSSALQTAESPVLAPSSTLASLAPSSITVSSAADSMASSEAAKRREFVPVASGGLKPIPEAPVSASSAYGKTAPGSAGEHLRKPNMEVLMNSTETAILPAQATLAAAARTASSTASYLPSADTSVLPRLESRPDLKPQPAVVPVRSSSANCISKAWAPPVPPHPVKQAPHNLTANSSMYPDSVELETANRVVMSSPAPHGQVLAPLNADKSDISASVVGNDNSQVSSGSAQELADENTLRAPIQPELAPTALLKAAGPELSTFSSTKQSTVVPANSEHLEPPNDESTKAAVFEQTETSGFPVSSSLEPSEPTVIPPSASQTALLAKTAVPTSTTTQNAASKDASSSVYDMSSELADQGHNSRTSAPLSEIPVNTSNYLVPALSTALNNAAKTQTNFNVDETKHGLLYLSIDHVKLSKVPLGTLVQVVVDNGAQRIESEFMSLAKLDKYTEELRIGVDGPASTDKVLLTIKLARQKASSWIKRLSYSRVSVGSDGSFAQCDLTRLCASNTSTSPGKRVDLPCYNKWTKSRPSTSAEVSVRSLYVPCVYKDEQMPQTLALAAQLVAKSRNEIKTKKPRAQGLMTQYGGDTPNGKQRYFVLDPVTPLLVACSAKSRRTRTLINLGKATAVESVSGHKFALEFKNGDSLSFTTQSERECEAWKRELGGVVESDVQGRPKWLDCVLYEGA